MKLTGIVFLLIFVIPGYSQQPDLLREADEFFQNKRYASAFSIYSGILRTEPDNAGLNYKIGICYLHSRSLKHKAAEHFEKALEKGIPLPQTGNGKEPEITYAIYRDLGDAYCINYKFDAAISAYSKFKEYIISNKGGDPAITESIDRKIELCRFGKDLKELVALPVNINPQKKTKNPKTAFDSSSVLSSDKTTRIFTYKVPVERIRKFDDAKYYEETEIIKTEGPSTPTAIVKTTKLVNGREPDTIIYVTTIGTSVDGQIVLSYRNDNGEGNLFITALRGNQWSSITKLDKTVNTGGWEPNETISPDGKTLYFSSERPGGYGGKDIYFCTKQSDGEWSRAVNLGPMVNSPYNDEAPYIHPDGSTLYFSSNRNSPAQYYENFTSNMNSTGNWSKPVAIGYPIDKSSDNVFYQVAADKKKVFPTAAYSGRQPKQKYADSIKEMNEKDNYVISFLNSRKIPLTLLKGKVTDKTGQVNGKAQIIVTDNVTGFVEGIYYSDNKGYYSLVLPAGKNNNITFVAAGTLFQSDNITVNTEIDYYKKHRIITLPELNKGASTLLNNVFFDSSRTTINRLSETELNRVLDLLKANPGIKIRLNNYIQCHSDICYSKKFSRERAKQAAAWLTQNGIAENLIEAKGYKKKKQKKEDDQAFTNEASLNRLELIIKEIK